MDTQAASVENVKTASTPHVWRFFRAGGFDQVRIDSGRDIANLHTLDQKLWVALACPTRGIEFDAKTLDLIDSEMDGRVRVREILSAIAWTVGLLKDPDILMKGTDHLSLEDIDDSTPLGAEIKASAAAILGMVGKGNARVISLQDVLDLEAIFDGTPFNGDGIITPVSAEDPTTRAVIEEIIKHLGSEPDRSHLPGISQELSDKFFADAKAFVAWQEKSKTAACDLAPFGDADSAALQIIDLGAKIDDFFTRVRLAAYDPRSVEALNPSIARYETLSAGIIAAADAEVAALPLAQIAPGLSLPLAKGLNPAWVKRMQQFRDGVVTPLFGARDSLSEEDWNAIKTRFSAYMAWRMEKPETALEKIGAKRLSAALEPSIKENIDALIARDKALAPQVNAISRVEKLLRLLRDLLPLVNNFVAFKDFYARTGKAVFQAGTLYLDARSCDLCLQVEDENKHALLASLSRIYLAYCRCTRDGGKEKMTIAAAFTGGDADDLLVGRNGVFYDRKGRDWDATIVKIIEHPISLRQAFWLPYRQLGRMIAEQVQKFAAARAANVQAQAATSFTTATTPPPVGAPPAPAAPAPTPVQQQQAFDAGRFAGIFAAIGLAIGAIGTAVASVITGFLQLTWWQMPLTLVGLVLIVSGPSCLIAAMKLQSRNLGPILDASGWAVNTRLKINLPFGRTLTSLAQFPEHAQRSLIDPYAEKPRRWRLYLVAGAIVGIAAVALWHFGIPKIF
jgi:hypothetical protein